MVCVNRWIVLGIVTAVAIVDQLVKSFLVAGLTPGHSYTIIPGFRLYLIRNSGAAFSMGSSATIVFTVIQVLAVIAVLVWPPRMKARWETLAFGLIGGGALGNLLDRLFRSPGFGVGHVVDFISVGRFAIFNLADSAITIGVVLYIAGVLFGGRQREAR